MKTIQLKRLFIAASIACMAAVGLCACSGQASTSSDEASSSTSAIEGLTGGVAATADGVEIMEDDVTTYIEDLRNKQGMTDEETWGTYLASYGMDPSSFREEIVDYFLDQQLIGKAAESEGISVSDEELEEQVNKMKANYNSDDAWQEALAQAGTTEEEYRSNVKNAMLSSALQEKIGETAEAMSDEELLSYVQMYADYFSGAKRSSHILFNLDDKETAESVLDQITKGTLSFEDAVSEYSQDSSKSNGGDVGWNVLNNFVTEYTDALEELEEGKLSGVVQSQFGYHIIKCTEVFTAPEDGVTSLDQVPTEMVEYIRSMMDESAKQSAYSEWYEAFREKANIVINPMPEGLPYDLDITKYQTEEEDSSDLIVDTEDADDTEEDVDMDESSEEDTIIEGELTDEDVAALEEELAAEDIAEGEEATEEEAA